MNMNRITVDARLHSTKPDEISSLIADIKAGKSDISINDVLKNIESLWRSEMINTANFTKLYGQVTDCKRILEINRRLGLYMDSNFK